MICWDIQGMVYGTESKEMDAKVNNREEETSVMKMAKVLKGPPYGQGVSVL
jgi:hypothetical protein